MEKRAMLNRIKELYNNGENIIKSLRGEDPTSIEDIMISYDFQAGSYTDKYYKNPKNTLDICNAFLRYIRPLGEVHSIFEAGVGEATKLVNIIKNISGDISWCGGADLSWSRIKAAQRFTHDSFPDAADSINLFVGDMMNLPLISNSIDLVYTMYALEPNGGRESTLLKELYRVTKTWLVLVEPSYELADEEQKAWMDYHGYVRGLKGVAEELGYNVVLYEKFPVDENPQNPSAIMIIKKECPRDIEISLPLCCPITKTPIRQMGNVYYSDENFLAYPVVNGVACLTEDHAIVATKMREYFN